jgi:hypothetical protein
LKQKILASDKGGRPGQWSAIKSMMLAKEYKHKMEEKGLKPYITSSKSQKSLERWMGEKWRTYDRKPAIRGEKTTDRFLPDKVWSILSKKEIEKTRRSKSRSRTQFVSNPKTIKEKAACYRKTHSTQKCKSISF